MAIVTKLIFLIMMITLSWQYQKIQQHDKLMRYYEQHSHFPIVHTYYNRHFSKARQFQDFLDVLEETQYRNKDYAKFIITDCQTFIQGQTFVCDELKKTKDNRAIFGYFPSSQFINFAGKKMQNPPTNRKMDHFSDVYTVDELERFFKPIIPNFYQEINNLQEYQQFLLPRYVPKIVFFSRQDSVPMVMNQLAVHFFLKFDFAFVSDLTESVTSKSNTTTFPTLLVVRYNYQYKIFELIPYKDSDFSELKYQEIKSFLEQYALVEQRNDILFHKIKMPIHDNIITTDSKVQLTRFLDMSSTWAIISEFNGSPTKLDALRSKYGKFFSYYHSLESTSEEEKLLIFDPKDKNSFELVNNDIQFKSLEAQDFLTNITAWLSKSFVVLGVRQQYGYICSLAQSTFFRGLTYCFIAKQSDYETISKRLTMQFKYGFVSYESRLNGTKKVKGRSFHTDKYQDIYLDTQYQTKLKTKQTVDAFIEYPIQLIDGDSSLTDLCAFPTKKCAILFTHSSKKKDRTTYDYLKDVSINYINEYQFYQIDLSCNPQFQKLIPALQKTLGGLVVYNQRTTSYVNLKAKITKTTIDKFLKINLTDNKKIPYVKLTNPGVVVHSCSKIQQKQTKQQEKIDIQQQL